MRSSWRMRYYPAVGPAIPHESVGRSRVTHPFAGHHCWCPRLACVKHAASVRPEPGSNSPIELISSRETLPRCLAWQRIRITIENVRVDSPRRPEKRRINESPRTSPISISIIKKRLRSWFRRKCARAFEYIWLAPSGQGPIYPNLTISSGGQTPTTSPRPPQLPNSCARYAPVGTEPLLLRSKGVGFPLGGKLQRRPPDPPANATFSMRPVGIEPTTCRLRVECSAN